MPKVTPLSKVKENKHGYLKLGFPDFYRWYRVKTKSKLPKDLVRDIILRIFSLCWEEIIKNYWVCTFPFNLGKVYISESYSIKKNAYKDWQRSREEGRIVRAYCYDTDGRKPYIKYVRSPGVPVKYAKLYKFEPIRGNKDTCVGYRGLWGHIKKQGLLTYRPHIQ